MENIWESATVRCRYRALSPKHKSKERNDSKKKSNNKDSKREIKSVFKSLTGLEIEQSIHNSSSNYCQYPVMDSSQMSILTK